MTWKNGSASIDGRAALVLIDDRFGAAAPVKELHHLVWVGVWCALPPGEHYWAPEETPVLDRIEDNLLKIVSDVGRGWAVYVMRICTRGIREYYFYVGEQVDLHRLATLVSASYPPYRIETSSKEDPGWAWYLKHLEAIRRQGDSRGPGPGDASRN
jgi:hypothetical protein